MKIIAFDPFISKEIAEKLNIQLVELDNLYADSDYITFHIPLTEETKNLISAKQIPLLKKGVRILNCAGEVL